MTIRDTVIDVLDETVANYPDKTALRHKREDGWWEVSWTEYRSQVMRAGRALIRLGVRPESCVVILGANRPEWFISDLAVIAVGGLPSGIYTTCTAQQCGYVIRHSEAVVAIIENVDHLSNLRHVRDQLAAVVVMEGDGDHDGVLGWNDFLALGDEVGQTELDKRIESLSSGDPCTLIYTSGTTGEPKGVLLSHHNVVWTARALINQFQVTAEDSALSYLPLSHIAEQVLSLYLPLVLGAQVSFAQSLETLAEDLREVRPTFFFAVPRVWEKIQARMEAAGATSGGLRRRLIRWARGVGLVGGHARQRGEPLPGSWWLADKLVFSRVRERLGLDRAKFFFTAAAPVARSTLEFFLGLGIPILEVYGMSESTGPTTFSSLGRFRTGSAGWAIPGTELKTADDGEILFRGPNVFLGYHKDPEQTRETLDVEGWVHSGDIGILDDEGFLYVTDRKKELIITSGGKNVAPVPIESKLKAIPGVAQAVVVGDRRNYLAALIHLDPEGIPALASSVGSTAGDPASAARCERIRTYLEERIDAVNARLAPYESIRRFAMIDGGLSVEDGTLTPTLKLKRRVISEFYAETIDKLYRED